jgi:GntR family transcriptional regulator
MPHMPLPPGLPKYYTISQEIIRRIREGDIAPGSRIPSENDIIRRHRVSNTTARKALLEIEKSGWALKIKGKGTIARSRSVTRSVNRILSFTNNMVEAGFQPGTRLLERELLKHGHAVLINGRRYRINGPTLRIRRLRLADEVPMMLEDRYLNLALCPGIAKADLEESLYQLYERECGLELTEVHQMLSAVMLETGVREHFGLEEPIPGFLVEGVTFCAKELILELERSFYRGDKYRFAVRALS